MKRLSQTEISSLLARSAARHQEPTQPVGMSLDAFYINLAKAANKDLEDGLITSAMHEARRTELRNQYRSLKASR